MLFHSLASSSDGNCALMKTRHTAALIDCGISLRAATSGFGPENLRLVEAVFITHEHGDHVKGVGALGRKLAPTPVYINAASAQVIHEELYRVNVQPLCNGEAVRVKDLTIVPFPVVHDTANAFGFLICEDGGGSLCYLTDTGKLLKSVSEIALKASALFIESNYDNWGLRNYDGYSESHKERIRRTHLSNEQTLAFLDKLGIERFNPIIMGHISPRSNRSEWVRAGFDLRFPDYASRLILAPTAEPLLISG